MTAAKRASSDLSDTVLRVCVACGVVNPAGPSAACEHLQLARFDGVDPQLAEALAEVAQVRRRYTDLVSGVTALVKQAIRDGAADLETPASAQTAVARRESAPSVGDTLVLSSPEPPTPPPRARGPRPTRKRRGPPPVDERQLDLMIHEPPKGHA